MRATFINKPGPPDSIQVGDLPAPTPTGTQVLVRVAAATVNPIDTYIRSGTIAMELPVPYVLGCDLAGTIEAVGPQVKTLQVGDRVWGSNQGLLGRQGTISEVAAVDECWLYPTPDGVNDSSAAAGALVGITAHLGLVDEANLQPGETVLVNGGSGAVGSTVIQMAKALGARVIATTSSPEKKSHCLALGADWVVDYRKDDVLKQVESFAPDGVNVWWETSRSPNFDLAVSCLAHGGRMVLMAGRDARPELPVGAFYVKCCNLLGFVMFLASPERQQVAAKAINGWLADGSFIPAIDRVVPLEETAAMHRLQEENTIDGTGTLRGKIVIRP